MPAVPTPVSLVAVNTLLSALCYLLTEYESEFKVHVAAMDWVQVDVFAGNAIGGRWWWDDKKKLGEVVLFEFENILNWIIVLLHFICNETTPTSIKKVHLHKIEKS